MMMRVTPIAEQAFERHLSRGKHGKNQHVLKKPSKKMEGESAEGGKETKIQCSERHCDVTAMIRQYEKTADKKQIVIVLYCFERSSA